VHAGDPVTTEAPSPSTKPVIVDWKAGVG